MIKRTIYFGNPSYLSVKQKQLVVKRPAVASGKECETIATIPIEDIGVVVADNPQITFTSALVEEMMANNVVLVTCDSRSMPSGMTLPIVGHSLQNERMRCQLSASVPLKKQLWQQTVQMKIHNQGIVLANATGETHDNMFMWAARVKSGDSDNMEARAAAYYWKNLFPDISGFVRERGGYPPNNLLDYGYAILRSVVARGLVSSGMFPSIGICHHNRYNGYCLADDIMEPYRPYVDRLVVDIVKTHGRDNLFLDREMKARLLSIPVLDVDISGKTSPLMVAVSSTTSSLYRCFSGESRKIVYPSMI